MYAGREMAAKNRRGRKAEVRAGSGGGGVAAPERIGYAASVGVARRFFQSQYHAIQMQVS